MIRITKVHVEFWTARNQPKWANLVKASLPSPSIDRLVNGHAGIRLTDGEMAANNLLAILRGARKRGELVDTLTRLGMEPGTLINPRRRSGYCWKWYGEIMKNRARSGD